MSNKQDKATTDRHTKTLRELIKRPENKNCADCKKNDPRWASWNLGVFLCIRCSGIHRSMGTHISKVKSIDLDVWTPEQMASIQKWGNRRANLYWEAHLRAGHTPLEHKMDSYVRSKYESKRWAREGPPPSDPSVLDADAPQAEPDAPPPVSAHAPTHTLQPSVSSLSSATMSAKRLQPLHQLLSTARQATSPSQQVPSQQVPPQQVPPQQDSSQHVPTQQDLFSLDFHSPAPASATVSPPHQQRPQEDVKAEIMSFFNSPTHVERAVGANGAGALFGALPAQAQFGGVGGGFGGMPNATSADVWVTIGQNQQQPQTPTITSMAGNAGVGMWGVNSGWTSEGLDVWSTPQAAGNTQEAAAHKDDDVLFGDLWSGFK